MPRKLYFVTQTALVGLWAHHAAADRIVSNFDFDWKFLRGESPGYNSTGSTCSTSEFSINMTGMRCNGLRRASSGDIGVTACRAACCSAGEGCEIYQYDPDNGPQGACWVGMLPPDPENDCVPDDAWTSQARDAPAGPYAPPEPGKQSCPQSPTCVDYVDTDWRSISVPHDFVVEGTFSPNASENHGFLPFDIGWYRKTFAVPEDAAGKLVYLDFDGVYRAADFWLNGVWLGHHESGYAPFRWYIHNATGATLNMGPGSKNILSVHVDALHFQEGWFYEGGGIYRHTTMTIAEPVSILPWGVNAPSVIAPSAEYTIMGGLDEPQTASAAIASVSVDIANALLDNQTYTLTTTLLDEDGGMVTRAERKSVIEGGGWKRVAMPLHWPEAPPAAGSAVVISPCTGGVSQRFTLADGTISANGTDGTKLCVAQVSPGRISGDLQMMNCQPGDPSQTFMYGSPKLPRNILAGNASSAMCLDVYGGYHTGSTMTKLDVFPCHANNANAREEFIVDETQHAIKAIGFDGEMCVTAMPSSQVKAGLSVSHRPAGSDPAVVNLWNLQRPYLYTVMVTLTTPAGLRDSVNTTIGVRSAIFTANSGFVLNGIPQKIKGLSMHQDFAGCGTAMPDAVNEYRVTELIKMGATGWRTAHNPVNKEILDFTDRHGMLVWNENRNLERQVIGMQAQEKLGSSVRRLAFNDVNGLYVPEKWKGVDPMYLNDAQALVLRDRNHPSVIIWSLCNEGGCMQGDPDGGYVGAAFKKAIFDADDSRPITANSEDTPGDTLTKVMDVNSFSYNYQEYDDFHIKYPFRTIIGGESASCVSDRTTYLPTCQGPGKGGGRCADPASGHVDSDAAVCAVSAWGSSAAERPWIVGNFAWTGLDYKGEPTPSHWPTINSHFGIKDIAGFDKDDTHYYYAWWKNDTKHLHILPSDWNSPVPVGTPINMAVFTAAASVELKVNGISLGKKPVPHGGVVHYDQTTKGQPILFHPGKLEAISWDTSGNVLATATVQTTKDATRLNLTLDHPGIGDHRVSGPVGAIKADGADVALIRVEVQDEDGNFVPSANHNISFSVTGPAIIYGVGNGDPSDHDPDKAEYRKAYKGLARVIVQSTRGDKTTGGDSTVMLSATATGLASASIRIPLSHSF